MTNSPRTAVVAVGGNALILDKQHEDVASQVAAVDETCKHIADMIERGWNVIVTHGNGPQVGFILRRNELSSHEVHTTPLDVIGADTQGAIGYMISRALDNEFTDAASSGRSPRSSPRCWSTATIPASRTRPRASAASPPKRTPTSSRQRAGW